MVKTTTGKGMGEIEWRRPREARDTAEARWFGPPQSADAQVGERPSFLELLLPLVALSLGSLFALAAAVALLIGALSLLT